MINISEYISSWDASLFGKHDMDPWHITAQAPEIIGGAIELLDSDYTINNTIAVHNTATVENGAILKGPVIIGPNCFVAATAYLRGGVLLDENCIIGPACELKTTFMFAGSKVAHLSFVGDSIIGSDVNIEAGAIIANYRNEMIEKRIKILTDGGVIDTGVDKFGALIGDSARIGANAVVAPGALIYPGYKLSRLGLLDQHSSRQR